MLYLATRTIAILHNTGGNCPHLPNLITALSPSYHLRFVQSDTEMKGAAEGNDKQLAVQKRSQWIRATYFIHWNLVLQADSLRVIADCEAVILFCFNG